MKRSDSEGRWADFPSARIRFAAQAAFLILVAAGAAIARMSPLAIVFLMFLAWLLVALIERAISREQAKAFEVEEHEVPIAETEPPVPEEQEEQAAIARPGWYRWLFWRRERKAVEALPAPTASLEERPSRSHVTRIEAEPPPLVEIEVEIASTEIIEAEPAAPGPSVTKRPLELPGLEEPEPARVAAEAPSEQPAVEAPPPPPPRLEAPLPPPDYRPAPPPLPKPPAREWNLWELERRAREEAGDAARDEEWTALFLNLRQFANAEGVLPKEFDDLVRESFSELIRAA